MEFHVQLSARKGLQPTVLLCTLSSLCLYVFMYMPQCAGQGPLHNVSADTQNGDSNFKACEVRYSIFNLYLKQKVSSHGCPLITSFGVLERPYN